MNQERLEDLSLTQRERLAFIEFRLYFMGEVKRADIIARFGVGPAVATRDFAMYKELAADNLVLDQSTKVYRIKPGFNPIFEHKPERVLSALTQGFGEGIEGGGEALLPCEYPLGLNRPAVPVLAAVTRAIHLSKPLRIKYHSKSSGLTEREVVPFALVDSGLRWHIRAYDRMRKDFLDFVISRILDPLVIEDGIVLAHEQLEQDVQWSRIVELELVPHPDQDAPEITALDFGMVDGVLRIRVRAATAGYMLRRWSVDCSSGHTLQDVSSRLWLRNHPILYGVSSAIMAPGYTQQ